MSDVRRDMAPSRLGATIEENTIEENTIESILSWTKWSRLQLHQDPDVLWTSSEIPYFIFNMVLNVSPTADPLAVIDAALSQARERKVPIAWWVGPSNPLPDLAKSLESRGLAQGAELTGMAVDLPDLNEKAAVPPGFTLSKVDDSDSLATWCKIMTTVSDFPDFASSAWLEMYQDIEVLDDPLWHLYLGNIDGTPVGTSGPFLGHGVAGIHGVNTIPEFRGRGIGTAMTLSPLIDARRMGYAIGVLFSSEMAVGLYRRLGFQEYGKGYIYLWQESE